MDTSGTAKRLLEKHPRNTYGIWDIYGEDPNCDWGGYHHCPFIESVEGTFEDAVAYAVSLPNFFTWGSGGEVKLRSAQTTPRKVTDKVIQERIDLMKRKLELENELDAVNKKLKG